MKLPSFKKLPIIPVIVAIFLAIGLIVFVNAYSKRGAFSTFNFWEGNEQIIESQNKDSDNDGLKDWQEDLYKTDPNNQDTDGDGYIDGEEINSGHNPLVKAPGDKQMFYPLPLGDQYNITKKVLNEETMGAVLESYFVQKGEYLSDHNITSPEEFMANADSSTIQEMFRRAFSESSPILLEKAETTLLEMPKIFDIEINDQDINISEDNSPEAINSYLFQISSILNSDNFFLQEQSLSALQSVFEDGDFSKIDSIIKDNDAKIEKAKKIVVPSSWKENHKRRLELILLIRNIFVSFRDIPNDPVKGYVALEEFGQFAEKWNNLVEKTKNLVESQKIEIP